MTDDPLRQSIAKLHTRLIDVIHGYETMETRGDAPLPGIARRMIELHARHRDALAGMLQAQGCEPSPEGSFMAVIQGGVMRARDWAGALDESAVPQLVKGERAVLDLYDEAVDAAAERAPVRLALLEQRRALALAVEGLEGRSAA